MNKYTFFGHTRTISRQLLTRVLLLSLIAILGLIALIIVGLRASLQTTQSQLNDASASASLNFATFLRDIEGDLKATSDAATLTYDREGLLVSTLTRQPAIFELQLVNPKGRVLTQRRRVGAGETTLTEQPWLETVQAGNIYIGPVDYEKYGVPFVDIAVPVFDKSGKFTATLVSRTDLTALWNPIISTRVGNSGYVYITDEEGHLLAYRDLKLVKSGVRIDDVTGRLPQTIADSGTNFYTGVGGQNVIASAKSLDVVPWFVIVEQPIQEALLSFALLSAILFILLVVVGFLVNNSFRFTQARIVSPLQLLQTGAEELQQGQLKNKINIQTQDEFGQLANTFNSMAAQLQEIIVSLEQRVAERTQALMIATEVSNRISGSITRDREQLIKEVVELVNSSFEFYHTQIYFIHPEKDELVLEAGTGEAGKILLQKGHRISKGKGLVGRAAEMNTPVLVSDVSKDLDWLPNPLLPETKSELAVPISLGETVIGVLDVQQNIPNGLTEEHKSVLQTVTNQIMIAAQNSRLLTDAQKRVEREMLITSINQKIQSTTTVENALQIAVREVGHALGVQTQVHLIPSAEKTERK
jgi:putative methionine-R-sulfoxide reductase with GAF domain